MISFLFLSIPLLLLCDHYHYFHYYFFICFSVSFPTESVERLWADHLTSGFTGRKWSQGEERKKVRNMILPMRFKAAVPEWRPGIIIVRSSKNVQLVPLSWQSTSWFVSLNKHEASYHLRIFNGFDRCIFGRLKITVLSLWCYSDMLKKGKRKTWNKNDRWHSDKEK